MPTGRQRRKRCSSVPSASFARWTKQWRRPPFGNPPTKNDPGDASKHQGENEQSRHGRQGGGPFRPARDVGQPSHEPGMRGEELQLAQQVVTLADGKEGATE